MVPLNVQPIEKRSNGNGRSLDVVSIWLTIQGEGPFAGQPAVFIRLAGCNLQCPGCDTDYTSTRSTKSVGEVVNTVCELSQGRAVDLVVITGGEPFRQDLSLLLDTLVSEDFRVQIETNGTLPPPSLPLDVMEEITVVCSPKAGSVAKSLQPWVQHLKYVVRAREVDGTDGLPTSVLGNGVAPAKPWPMFAGTIYVQPMDEGDSEKNQANTKAAADSCLKHGYTLCLQLHKIVGLD